MLLSTCRRNPPRLDKLPSVCDIPSIQVFLPGLLPHPDALGVGVVGGGACRHGAVALRVVWNRAGVGQVSQNNLRPRSKDGSHVHVLLSCFIFPFFCLFKRKADLLSCLCAAASLRCVTAVTSGRTSPSMTASLRSTRPERRLREENTVFRCIDCRYSASTFCLWPVGLPSFWAWPTLSSLKRCSTGRTSSASETWSKQVNGSVSPGGFLNISFYQHSYNRWCQFIPYFTAY